MPKLFFSFNNAMDCQRIVRKINVLIIFSRSSSPVRTVRQLHVVSSLFDINSDYSVIHFLYSTFILQYLCIFACSGAHRLTNGGAAAACSYVERGENDIFKRQVSKLSDLFDE